MKEITRNAMIGSGKAEHDHVVLSYKSLAKNTQQLVFLEVYAAYALKDKVYSNTNTVEISPANSFLL
jgi:hypothetical protein